MASSVDGRTLHSRWRPKASGADLFESVHDELAGDAWLVGRAPAMSSPRASLSPVDERDLSARALVRAPRRRPMASCSTFTARSAGAVRASAAVRSLASRAREARGRADRCRPVRGSVGCALGGSTRRRGVYIFAGKSELDLALALDILNREVGVKRQLLEEAGSQRSLSARGIG